MISNQNNPEYNRLLHEQRERLKELACINQTTSILKEARPIEESLQQIVLVLPAAWQYPEYTVARIRYEGKTFLSVDFIETNWRMTQEFNTIDGEKGQLISSILKNSAQKMRVHSSKKKEILS